MLYPKNQSKKLDLALFKNPTAEYRCTPFWAWNCDLDQEVLEKEIDVMKQMGMGGFHMHTRVGMSTKYLSDEYMSFIKGCTEKAKKENMLAWLYDEDKWPSGFGGGYVTAKKENRQKYIMFTTVPYSDTVKEEQMGNASALAKRSDNGYLIAKYSVKLDSEGYLEEYKRIVEEEAAEGDIWYAYLETPLESAWFNFQTYVDTLSKSAIDDFVSTTHERYKQVVGDEFDKTVPAIFTDEPQVTKKKVLDHSTDKTDLVMPYTTDFEDTYFAAYGEKFLDKLPEVVWDKKGVISVTRYRYHDHVTERFVSAFCDNIGGWCKENNLLMTGHMMEEPTLETQTCAIGEAMRAYRSYGLPGVDMLCDWREYTTVKQAASATHQYGYPGVLSELYGVTNWDFDFRGHKLQGDWQAALGVSVRVPHLYWVSMKGEAKRDYPASIGHQSAWYPEYSYIEDHYARVNTLMTRGKADIKIGVIHPIESYWINFGPNDKSFALRNQLDENFLNLAETLLFNTLDFDYICESTLPIQFKDSETGFAVGEMTYDVVLVPDCITLRRTTLEALEKFVSKGGKVIFIGRTPTLIDAVPSDDGRKLFEKCEYVNWDNNAIISSLTPYRNISVMQTKEGKASTNIFGALRNDGDGKNLFLCHVNPTSRVKVDVKENYTVTVKGEYKPTVMDTLSGETYTIPATYKDGTTVFDWECDAQSSILVRLDNGRAETFEENEKIEEEYSYLNGKAELILHEPNVCVLDMARWCVDDGQWQPEEEMLRIGVAAKKALKMSVGSVGGAQPWAAPKEVPTHTITVETTFNSEVELDNVQLALEDFEDAEIIYNGNPVTKKVEGYYVDLSITRVNLGKVNKGKNTIVVKKPFATMTNTENMFLLGDFSVNVLGSFVTLDDPKREIYCGDWTRQGLAFYGGVATYRFKIEGGRDMDVALGLFAAPCVTVELDGERVSNVSLAPYRAKLGNLDKGEHTLDITVHASRINTFGALHLADRVEDWFGPTAWRKEEGDWCYEYRLTESGLLTAPRIYTKK